MTNKRLTAEERKKDILEKAIVLFTEKGYSGVTMEDVVAATGLSKGGLYHYYKSTDDILYDLMVGGIDYRHDIIAQSMKESLDGGELDFIAEQFLNKMLDDNPYMPVYVEFLLAKRHNEKLEDLFLLLKEKAFHDLKTFFPNALKGTPDDDFFNFLTDMINTMILGSEVLHARENFTRHRKQLLIMVKDMLQSK